MSMPRFPDRKEIFTREESVNASLTSIAMEELALSHILNAEGEKIQYILAKRCTDSDEVIAVNESVASLIGKVTDLQFLLKMKMQLTKDFLPPENSCSCLCNPCRPCKSESHKKSRCKCD